MEFKIPKIVLGVAVGVFIFLIGLKVLHKAVDTYDRRNKVIMGEYIGSVLNKYDSGDDIYVFTDGNIKCYRVGWELSCLTWKEEKNE